MAALITGIQAELLRGFEVNANGTVKVLEAASKTGVERVVFTARVQPTGILTVQTRTRRTSRSPKTIHSDRSWFMMFVR